MPEDIRKTDTRPGPRSSDSGSGAAYGSGYGAGGLGSGGDRAAHEHDPWNAPGVTPDGQRTGSSTDGPRIAMAEESEPKPPAS